MTEHKECSVFTENRRKVRLQAVSDRRERGHRALYCALHMNYTLHFAHVTTIARADFLKNINL